MSTGTGPIRVGVLTVSDAASRGEREDESGALIAEWCRDRDIAVPLRAVVPDETETVAGRLAAWSDDGEVDVILTTGGTGFAPRDVTPEATRAVLDRSAPGVAEAFRRAGSDATPYAILSRGVAGIRGRVFIANFPGSPGGVRDGLSVLAPILEHVVELLRDEDVDHDAGTEETG